MPELSAPASECGFAMGARHVAVTDPACLAKTVTDPDTQRVRYYLKRCTYGPNSGKLYNPHTPFSEPSAAGSHGNTGLAHYEFRKATPEAFAAYLKFLQTNNPAHIRIAERE